MTPESALKLTLKTIEYHDSDYDTRYWLIVYAVADATIMGLKAGFRVDPKEPEWLCAYIELPTGQVTWHLPQHPIEWDGHTTAEKYQRIREYINGA
jgi:hypothetical protein